MPFAKALFTNDGHIGHNVVSLNQVQDDTKPPLGGDSESPPRRSLLHKMARKRAGPEIERVMEQFDEHDAAFMLSEFQHIAGQLKVNPKQPLEVASALPSGRRIVVRRAISIVQKNLPGS